MTRKPTYEELRQKTGELERELESIEKSEEKLKHQSEYMLALNETIIGIMDRLDQKNLLGTILERATSLAGTKNAFIYLFEPFETEIEIKIATGFYKNLIGFRIKHGEGVAGRVWKTAQPLLIEDYHAVCLQKVLDKWGIKIREGFRSQIPFSGRLSNL